MSLKICAKQIEYQPVPEGSYMAICYSVIDIGRQYSERFKKTSDKVILIWELCDDDLREDFGRAKPERRVISKEYTASLNEKSNLYKDIRPWIGREFSEDMFNLAELAGKPCTLSVINEKGSDGKIRAYVSSVSPVVKGVHLGAPENPTIIYDIDESPEDVFWQIPEWIQKRIQSCKNPEMKQSGSVSVNIDIETGEVTATEAKIEPDIALSQTFEEIGNNDNDVF